MEIKQSDEKSESVRKKVTIETLLIEDLGQFGWYQLRNVVLLSVAVIFIAWSSTEYIFTTARITSRCLIPECELREEGLTFSPEWLPNAIPTTNTAFDNCRRFGNRSMIIEDLHDECPALLFNQQTVLNCEEYVYENTNTVVYDFDLACDEWRRSFIGSLRNIGMFVALSMIGYVSDRWGRRTALAITSINTAWIGVLRVFANSYVGFLMFVLFESILGSGGFSCAYIIVNEMTGPKYRIATSALMSTCFAMFQGVFGLIAWALPNWRDLTLAIYIPQFIAISFFWILPESARWYYSKERYDDAENIFRNMARLNGKNLPEQKLIALRETVQEEIKRDSLLKEDEENEPWLVVLVFRHKAMLVRCIVMPVCWITMTLVYYGLTVNAVNISGNPYLNFVAVSLVEIPGFWLAYLMLETTGRKPALITGFFVCAVCQLTYLVIPSSLFTASLVIYLVGKCAIAVVLTSLYVYTTELFPTKYRHRLFGYSSMMGRIGSLVAPLTPAFGDQVPFILFGSMALLSGLLVLLTPETRGASLPDTMQQAVDTGTTRH